jgi:hypothetical protein
MFKRRQPTPPSDTSPLLTVARVARSHLEPPDRQVVELRVMRDLLAIPPDDRVAAAENWPQSKHRQLRFEHRRPPQPNVQQQVDRVTIYCLFSVLPLQSLQTGSAPSPSAIGIFNPPFLAVL